MDTCILAETVFWQPVRISSGHSRFSEHYVAIITKAAGSQMPQKTRKHYSFNDDIWACQTIGARRKAIGGVGTRCKEKLRTFQTGVLSEAVKQRNIFQPEIRTTKSPPIDANPALRWLRASSTISLFCRTPRFRHKKVPTCLYWY